MYYNSVREYQIRLSQRPIGSARRVIDFLHRVIADTIVMDAFVLVVPRLNKARSTVSGAPTWNRSRGARLVFYEAFRSVPRPPLSAKVPKLPQ